MTVPARGSERITALARPARVKRTGNRQLSVSLSDEESERLEAFRRQYGLRSWGAAVRALIDWRMNMPLLEVIRCFFELSGAESIEIHSGDHEPGRYIRREDVIPKGGDADGEQIGHRQAHSRRQEDKSSAQVVTGESHPVKQHATLADEACPRCGNDTPASDIVDGRCGECRLHEDEADWTDEAEGPLN